MIETRRQKKNNKQKRNSERKTSRGWAKAEDR